LAKIAVELERALASRAASGARGEATPRVLAEGDGWTVADVLCTSGWQDRPFEEQHSFYTIAMVTTGTFQYRGAAGCEFMSPGALVLGNAGQYFECGHEHGAGDHCLAFWYTPEYFERLAADAGAGKAWFPVLRLPPVRQVSSLGARVLAALSNSKPQPATNAASVPVPPSAKNIGMWEELSLQLGAQVLRLVGDAAPAEHVPLPSTLARVTRVVRMIERDPRADLAMGKLARQAGLSPYHFLRIFERVTGLTPHQYVLRARLREAAVRLAAGEGRILDIALDCGFGDVSNFNRAFRAEFGASPREFRGHSAASSWLPASSENRTGLVFRR
jgi:AraC family transcriptional regulator